MNPERREESVPRETDTDRRLRHALASQTRDGRIPCAAVFSVARAQGVSVAEAGRAAERLRIKITGCQLGCFP